MRFSRYPHPHQKLHTTGRRAAARSAIAKEKARFPLFAAAVADDIEARLKEQDEFAAREAARLRQWHAAQWRRARKAVQALPPTIRQALRHEWAAGILPGSPEYLLDLVHRWRDRP